MVADSGGRFGKAVYRPNISEADQREFEMDCVQEGALFRTVKHKRMFYRNMDRIIGASRGEETTYVYAEHLSSGEVHGRPITRAELLQKGAVL
jgi:hypothetical protein